MFSKTGFLSQGIPQHPDEEEASSTAESSSSPFPTLPSLSHVFVALARHWLLCQKNCPRGGTEKQIRELIQFETSCFKSRSCFLLLFSIQPQQLMLVQSQDSGQCRVGGRRVRDRRKTGRTGSTCSTAGLRCLKGFCNYGLRHCQFCISKQKKVPVPEDSEA